MTGFLNVKLDICVDAPFTQEISVRFGRYDRV